MKETENAGRRLVDLYLPVGCRLEPHLSLFEMKSTSGERKSTCYNGIVDLTTDVQVSSLTSQYTPVLRGMFRIRRGGFPSLSQEIMFDGLYLFFSDQPFIISPLCTSRNALIYIHANPNADRVRVVGSSSLLFLVQSKLIISLSQLHDISLGMIYLHALGVIHGDLKAVSLFSFLPQTWLMLCPKDEHYHVHHLHKHYTSGAHSRFWALCST
jgi:hypothetical protein